MYGTNHLKLLQRPLNKRSMVYGVEPCNVYIAFAFFRISAIWLVSYGLGS